MEENFIDELKSSRKLENSLVSFLPDLLEKFFGGDIDEATFKREFKDKSCQSKMYLAYMPQDLLDANQQIFDNEFCFADRINDAIFKKELSGQEFQDALKKFIVEYNAADT